MEKFILQENDLNSKAEWFIHKASYFKFIQSQGRLYYTGSYYLKTMTWLDIDMQLVLNSDSHPENIVLNIFKYLVEDKNVHDVRYINFTERPVSPLPRGLYIGCKCFDSEISNDWKLDLWILSEEDFLKNRNIVEKIRSEMTLEEYDVIMQIKKEWTQNYGKPPKSASYFLYQAVVFEKLHEQEPIYAYLKNKGVRI